MPRDTAEFFKLLKPHYNLALKYCRALARKGKVEQAEDIFQSSILKAMENFNSLKEDNKFKFWLYTIITNVHRDTLRRSFWGKFITLEEEEHSPMLNIYTYDKKSENSDVLLRALSKISAKEKTAILLFEVAGFSIDEIMEIQGEKSSSCIKQRLSRSREKLKNIIIKTESAKYIKQQNENRYNDTIEEQTLKLVSEINSKANE